jgi:hypothetical protein
VKVKADTSQFNRDMNNIIKYSMGFLEGAQAGKNIFLAKLGGNVCEIVKEFIDTNAKLNPAMLHHVYEWYQVGSPSARLYDITYTVSNLGLSLRSTFRQSASIKNGSKVPFYDKARIMEQGIPVTIRPVSAKALAFTDDNGEQVFTKQPVRVSDPGGPQVQGSFQKVFDSFFSLYMSQSFLMSSGVAKYLSEPMAYKKDFPLGKRTGKGAGISAGYRWIVGAGDRL